MCLISNNHWLQDLLLLGHQGSLVCHWVDYQLDRQVYLLLDCHFPDRHLRQLLVLELVQLRELAQLRELERVWELVLELELAQEYRLLEHRWLGPEPEPESCQE
jgi:hypothetical protein